MTRAKARKIDGRAPSSPMGGVSAVRLTPTPVSGINSVPDPALRAMLAGGEIVGVGEEAPDRFAVQWDGVVFRAAVDHRLFAVTASWPAIVDAMDREADAAEGLDAVPEGIRETFAAGLAVRFLSLDAADLGVAVAVMRFMPDLPWREARFMVCWAATGLTERFRSWFAAVQTFGDRELGFQAVVTADLTQTEGDAA